MPDSSDNIMIVTHDKQYGYIKNESEHAILTRFYPEPNAYPVILICGRSSRGNQGAAHYLSKNYDGYLRKTFGNKKPFC